MSAGATRNVAVSEGRSQHAAVSRLALRPREAAEALGISERKLRQLLGRIPHVRLDGMLLFPVEALRAWLADQARTSSDKPADALAKRVLRELRR